MQIIINHLTRMSSGYICVAGLDVTTNQHIRPVLRYQRLTTNDLASRGGLFDIAARVELGQVTRRSAPPHVEDFQFTQVSAQRLHDPNPAIFWDLLQQIAQPRLQDIFGPNFTIRGLKGTVAPDTGTASLGCLRPTGTPRLEIRSGTRGDRLFLLVCDADHTLELAVTDLRLFCNDLATIDAGAVRRVNERLAYGVEVLLSVGLGRPFPPETPQCWLQVNNLHLSDEPNWLLVASTPDDHSENEQEEAALDYAMPWENEARQVVLRLLETAQWDEEDQSVTLDDGDRYGGSTLRSFDALKERLMELYNEQWYANVPFEGGEAVFDDDAYDAVDELLGDVEDELKRLGWN